MHSLGLTSLSHFPNSGCSASGKEGGESAPLLLFLSSSTGIVALLLDSLHTFYPLPSDDRHLDAPSAKGGGGGPWRLLTHSSVYIYLSPLF